MHSNCEPLPVRSIDFVSVPGELNSLDRPRGTLHVRRHGELPRHGGNGAQSLDRFSRSEGALGLRQKYHSEFWNTGTTCKP